MKQRLKSSLLISLMPLISLNIIKKAEAIPIKIGIEAQVNYVEDKDNLLKNKVKLGDILKGSYIFDSQTPDTDYVHGSLSDSVGRYWHYSGPYGFSLHGGGFNFKSNPNDNEFLVEICNNHSGRDNYNLRSYKNNELYPGVSVDHIHWQLDDKSGTALNSDALPLTAPILENWKDSWVGLTLEGGIGEGCGRPSYFIRSKVNSVEIIPEPTKIGLLGLGGMMLNRKRMKKRDIH